MLRCCVFFFFNDTATTEIYTLSLHDALPICTGLHMARRPHPGRRSARAPDRAANSPALSREPGVLAGQRRTGGREQPTGRGDVRGAGAYGGAGFSLAHFVDLHSLPGDRKSVV